MWEAQSRIKKNVEMYLENSKLFRKVSYKKDFDMRIDW